MSNIIITNTRPEHLEQLAEHQRICFPTLDPAAWMNVEDFAEHLRVFPQGQHVALDGERVVGQSSTFRVGDRALRPHGFLEITGNLRFTEHEPDGLWLYGADMSVHPEYRGRKLSKRLYDARKELVRRLHMRGIVAGGQLPGYDHYRGTMAIEDYLQAVTEGRLFDPTLTPQLRSGFVVRGMLPDYLDDAEHGSEASLIVWENPNYGKL
ncbi:MAG TPA: GNAT family N-acetyltransferase [Roseiflexaceae bacterium]|nr:GNAT family N-acetyltransferase [Roseiflexaceae bacterium]